MTDEQKDDIVTEFQSLLADLLAMPYEEFKFHFGDLAVDIYKAVETHQDKVRTIDSTDEVIQLIMKEMIKMRSPLYKAINDGE